MWQPNTKSIQYKRMARCDIFITTFQSFLFQYWLGILTLTRMCSNYKFSSPKNFKCLRHRISIYSICWYVNMWLLKLQIVGVITFDQNKHSKVTVRFEKLWKKLSEPQKSYVLFSLEHQSFQTIYTKCPKSTDCYRLIFLSLNSNNNFCL